MIADTAAERELSKDATLILKQLRRAGIPTVLGDRSRTTLDALQELVCAGLARRVAAWELIEADGS